MHQSELNIFGSITVQGQFLLLSPNIGIWIVGELYLRDMIARLTSTIEYQSKVVTEVAILTMLQQRLDRFVILEITDKSSAWLHDVVTIFIYAMIRKQTQLLSVQKLQSSLTLPTIKCCIGYKKTLHPQKSLTWKDSLVINLVCHNCKRKVLIEKLCCKSKKSKENTNGSF